MTNTTEKRSKSFLTARAVLLFVLTIVLIAFLSRVVQSLVAIVVLVPIYLFGNVLLVAWIRREWDGWRRGTKAFALRQVRPLTAGRLRATGLAHVVALGALMATFRQRLEILEVALLLLLYVTVVSALMLSLLAQMPAFRRLWSDVFTRVLLLGTPFVLAYMTKGYSQMWLDETLAVGAENAPMARFAGTVMMAGIAAATLLLPSAIAFELAIFLIPLIPASSERKRRRRNEALKAEGKQESPGEGGPSVKAMFKALFWAKREDKSSEASAWRSLTRRLGVLFVFSLSFLSCIVGGQAALSPFKTGFGKVLLAAIAFDFDAALAVHCSLTKDEARDAAGKEPKLKALMLATSQEKAVLVTRGSELFKPVVLKHLSEEVEARKLVVGRSTTCFEALSRSTPSP